MMESLLPLQFLPDKLRQKLLGRLSRSTYT
jgi:hypothetical protein